MDIIFLNLDPAYPPSRQIVYLSVARPRALVVLRKAGRLDGTVREYVTNELNLVTEIPGLELLDDGTLRGGVPETPRAGEEGKDVFEGLESMRRMEVDVEIGPDSIGTLSFTSGSTGIPKGET
jgi:L-2-aminoadipate reductase